MPPPKSVVPIQRSTDRSGCLRSDVSSPFALSSATISLILALYPATIFYLSSSFVWYLRAPKRGWTPRYLLPRTYPACRHTLSASAISTMPLTRLSISVPKELIHRMSLWIECPARMTEVPSIILEPIHHLKINSEACAGEFYSLAIYAICTLVVVASDNASNSLHCLEVLIVIFSTASTAPMAARTSRIVPGICVIVINSDTPHSKSNFLSSTKHPFRMAMKSSIMKWRTMISGWLCVAKETDHSLSPRGVELQAADPFAIR